MSKCLECGEELTQTPGKREKQYCGNTCRVKFYLKKKNEGKEPKKRGRKRKGEQSTEPIPPKPNTTNNNGLKKSAAEQLEERLKRMG